MTSQRVFLQLRVKRTARLEGAVVEVKAVGNERPEFCLLKSFCRLHQGSFQAVGFRSGKSQVRAKVALLSLKSFLLEAGIDFFCQTGHHGGFEAGPQNSR